MDEETISVAVESGGSVTAIRHEPERRSKKVRLIYAPGAGANVHDPFGRFLCWRLADHEIASVRFQFPYMEAKKRGPDRPPVLESTWRAVIEASREEQTKLIVGGRSMGGRIATQVAAQGEAVDGLALFAYPLHPPGNTEKMRDAHLPSMGAPAFFCSGTRDAFASPEELRALLKRIPDSTLHLLEGADHGYSVPKSTGRSKEDVWSEAADAFEAWLAKAL
jgi:predicted alpha/beta-hydrolase family hydrolase